LVTQRLVQGWVTQQWVQEKVTMELRVSGLVMLQQVLGLVTQRLVQGWVMQAQLRVQLVLGWVTP
jgi:hypothetical protein